MRIVFLPHWEFLSKEVKASQWLQSLAEELRQKGHHVALFQAERDQLSTFDVIHVFSDSDSEMWSALTDIHEKVLVTPSLKSEAPLLRSFQVYWRDALVHLIRSILQRRWPPIDEWSWYLKPTGYLVFDLSWKEYLFKQWNVPFSRVDVIPLSQVSQNLEEVYVKFFSSTQGQNLCEF